MDGAWSSVQGVRAHGLTKNECLQPNIGVVRKFINLSTFLHLAGKLNESYTVSRKNGCIPKFHIVNKPKLLIVTPVYVLI